MPRFETEDQWLGYPVDTDLTFKRADRIERTLAVRFRDAIYKAETGHAPSDDLDDRAIHLIAVDIRSTIVAAARMVGQELRPFEFEQQLNLSSIADPEARIGLVGRFCVAPEYRQIPRSLRLHLGMLKLMYLVAKKEGLTHLVMYTFDHLLTFYRGAYFTLVKDMTFFHKGYNTQMHLMLFDLIKFEADNLCAGGRLEATFASIEAIV